MAQLERELAALVKLSPACTALLSIPGIGLLTTTALVAAASGDVTHFKDARHFASWFGLTPREHSSGSSRCLGSTTARTIQQPNALISLFPLGVVYVRG
jgi:transposase